MDLDEIIRLKGFDPKTFRLVRHGFKEIDPLRTYQSNRALFEAYQSFQSKGKFADAKYIAAFAPFHGTQAMLLGVWRVDGETIPNSDAPPSQLTLIASYNWSLDGSYYHLCEQSEFNEFSGRLIIDWGGSTRSWVQTKTSKPVTALLPPNAIAEFESYESTVLMHHELVQMMRNSISNYTWHNALRSVNGIYCITDTRNGRNYVGSAYGAGGIWGRWSNYSLNGHGDNKRLVALLAEEPQAVEALQFSILEILPATSTPKDAVTKENLWKQKLGSRVGGYNHN